MSIIVNKISNFIYVNSIAFVVIVFITFINGPSYPFVGNLIWLPLGAVSLCYLLFGFKIFMTVFFAIQFSDYLLHGENFFSYTTTFLNTVDVFAPMLAIASMKFFKLSNFFDDEKVVFQHLLFLAILTALCNTLLAFFMTSYLSGVDQSIKLINATQFIENFLIGDILGCLIILFFAALVIVPGIRYFAPELVPSDIDN